MFIILSIIGAIGLGFLLAALACNISCNGSVAGAAIVGILGIIGIIWLLGFAIDKIRHHHKKTTAEKAD